MADNVWEQIAQTLNGTVVGGTRFWEEQKVQAPVKIGEQGAEWTVTLDNYTVVVPAGKVMIPIRFTRAYAPFLTQGDLRLSLCRANLFSPLAALFGGQDIQTGESEFDRRYVIKASQPEQALRLLNGDAGGHLRDLLDLVPDVNLSVVDDGRRESAGGRLPHGVDLIYVYSARVETAEDLRLLYDVAAEMLRGLVRIGSASAESPSPLS